MKPIAAQLYSLRAEAEQDFVRVLRRLAEIGYAAVEPAGFHGLKPRDFARTVRELGMEVCSTHSPWAKPDTLNEVIDTLGVLGTDIVAGGYQPEAFHDMDSIKRTADECRAMSSRLSEHGITLVVHNHWWEFETLEGRLKYDIFAELAPEVRLELDTYWAANFGANDPVELIRKYRHRCPVLHIKDGTLKREDTLVPVGSGSMDMSSLVGTIDEDVTQWLIVEQDNSATDMFECMEQSYAYLTEQGLAEGKR